MAAVLDIVERLTGYPPDLLDLDLDLEADLGVDTVKQAEVFAAVREQFAIPRDDDLKLRDFPTLIHVIGFVRDRAPAGVAAAAPEQAEATEMTGTTASTAPAAALIAVPAFTGDVSASEMLLRRVPVPVLRPPARACKPTGVTLDGTKRVIVMADEAGVAEALVKRLGALGVATLVLGGRLCDSRYRDPAGHLARGRAGARRVLARCPRRRTGHRRVGSGWLA